MTYPAIAIAVRASPEAAEDDLAKGQYTAQTTSCTPDGNLGQFGTLVVTPGDSEGRAAVAIIAATDAFALRSCTPANGYANCIVARRLVSFSSHTSLTLPISLDIECKGIGCAARSTCRAKDCIPSEAPCEDGACMLKSDGGTGDDGSTTVRTARRSIRETPTARRNPWSAKGWARCSTTGNGFSCNDAGPGSAECADSRDCGVHRLCCTDATSGGFSWTCKGTCDGALTEACGEGCACHGGKTCVDRTTLTGPGTTKVCE